MARTWALKEDGVNMTIIHWYSTRRTYGLLTPEPPTIWHLIKSGFSNYESRSDPVMSKPEMTLRTQFSTLAMFRSAKEVRKHTLKMSCMFPPSQRIWSQPAKWLSKACKFDSTKKGASSKKKAKSSRAEEERVGCSFSIRTRWNPPCSQKPRKPTPT